MPKLSKLHIKGKPNSLQKQCNTSEDNTNRDPDEVAKQFQLELCWCIQQLEKTLNENKGDQKHLQEAWKVLTVLKNNNQPIIRKRQLMRTHFGDYRAKMASEEKKLVKMASKIKISESTAQPKATFLRKSAFLTTGENFKFNFNLPVADFDSGSSKLPNDGNTVENVKPNEVLNNSTKEFKFSFSNSDFKFNFTPENS